MASFETQLLLNLNEFEFDTSTELTVEMIKKRYRELSLHFHTDLNSNEIFREKQKKINGAKEFLLDNLDDINRYIRKVNHRETDDDKARNEKEQWDRDERARRAYYEQQAREKQEKAKAEEEKAKAEKAKAEAEKAKAEAEKEKARAQQQARNAEREASAARAQAEAAEARAREAERARLEAEKKKKTVKSIIIAAIALVIGIPLIIGAIMAGVEGFNEGMEADKQSEAAADKAAKTMKITDTNLPKTFVKGAKVNWSDYYVAYKDKDGNEVKITLADGMVSINYEDFEEQEAEIKVNNGSVYLYHKLTVLNANLISNVESLKAIANDPKGTYLLDADIDLGGAEWTPIAGFEGKLLGNGHTIKNLTITSFTAKNVGLFDTIKEKAQVSDLKLENVSISSTSSAESIGALAGMLEGTVSNITVMGKIESVGSPAVGGVIGFTNSWDSAITNCSFAGTVIGNNGVGGIMGGKELRGQVLIDGCTVSGSISGTSCVGGIIGDIYTSRANTYDIKNCKNNATVTARTEYCGGIIGRMQNSNNYGVQTTSLINCENNGEINGGKCTGGIVGALNLNELNAKATIDNNVNNANVTGKNYTGGIIGYSHCTYSIVSGANKGKVTGEAYVGGFVGFGDRSTLNGLTNDGTVVGHYYVGGIVGFGESVSNCTNNGNVSATLIDTENNIVAVGGVCGRIITADGCVNNGNINSKSGASVGGVIGIAENHSYDSQKFTNCKNNGEITVNSLADGVGGVMGSFVNRNGYGNISVSFTGFENNGKITVASGKAVGGVIGYCKSNKKLSIVSCSSTAEISASTCSSVGGILGLDATSDKYNLAKISYITVTGAIHGKTSVGSVIGSAAVEPENYADIKTTYTVENNPSLEHFGAIG